MDTLIYRYKLEEREGLLVELIDEEGKRGIGEIAPLPGWSRETLGDVIEELKAGELRSPSVQFGLESAYLSLLPIQLPLSFPICSLLMGNAVEILQEAESLSTPIVKVKLSALKDEEALDVLKELRKRFRLRIDLNRRWILQRSLKFFSHFSREDFDFIEEPCDRVQDLIHFPFPIGVDESLRDTALEKLVCIPHLKALVFKPTLQGGMHVGRTLADLAINRDLDLIFSACYESGVGIAQIALLARHLGVPIKPLGLDTYRYLKKDVLKKPLDFSNGCLHLRNPLFELKKEICSVPLLHLRGAFQKLALLQPTNCV